MRGEVDEAAELSQLSGVAAGAEGVRVGHQGSPRRCAIAPPQLGPVRAVVSDEEEDTVQDCQESRARRALARLDVCYPSGAGGRAVASPELAASRGLRFEEDSAIQ